jgi:hypothetical protein
VLDATCGSAAVGAVRHVCRRPLPSASRELCGGEQQCLKKLRTTSRRTCRGAHCRVLWTCRLLPPLGRGQASGCAGARPTMRAGSEPEQTAGVHEVSCAAVRQHLNTCQHAHTPSDQTHVTDDGGENVPMMPRLLGSAGSVWNTKPCGPLSSTIRRSSLGALVASYPEGRAAPAAAGGVGPDEAWPGTPLLATHTPEQAAPAASPATVWCAKSTWVGSVVVTRASGDEEHTGEHSCDAGARPQGDS